MLFGYFLSQERKYPAGGTFTGHFGKVVRPFFCHAAENRPPEGVVVSNFSAAGFEAEFLGETIDFRRGNRYNEWVPAMTGTHLH